MNNFIIIIVQANFHLNLIGIINKIFVENVIKTISTLLILMLSKAIKLQSQLIKYMR